MTSPDRPAVVLALNSGSSSLKFGLYRVDSSHLEALVSGEADFTGDGKGQFRADDAQGAHLVRETASLTDQRDAIVRVGRLLADTGMPEPTPPNAAPSNSWTTHPEVARTPNPENSETPAQQGFHALHAT